MQQLYNYGQQFLIPRIQSICECCASAPCESSVQQSHLAWWSQYPHLSTAIVSELSSLSVLLSVSNSSDVQEMLEESRTSISSPLWDFSLWALRFPAWVNPLSQGSHLNGGSIKWIFLWFFNIELFPKLLSHWSQLNLLVCVLVCLRSLRSDENCRWHKANLL